MFDGHARLSTRALKKRIDAYQAFIFNDGLQDLLDDINSATDFNNKLQWIIWRNREIAEKLMGVGLEFDPVLDNTVLVNGNITTLSVILDYEIPEQPSDLEVNHYWRLIDSVDLHPFYSVSKEKKFGGKALVKALRLILTR